MSAIGIGIGIGFVQHWEAPEELTNAFVDPETGQVFIDPETGESIIDPGDD